MYRWLTCPRKSGKYRGESKGNPILSHRKGFDEDCLNDKAYLHYYWNAKEKEREREMCGSQKDGVVVCFVGERGIKLFSIVKGFPFWWKVCLFETNKAKWEYHNLHYSWLSIFIYILSFSFFIRKIIYRLKEIKYNNYRWRK